MSNQSGRSYSGIGIVPASRPNWCGGIGDQECVFCGGISKGRRGVARIHLDQAIRR